MQIEDDRKPLNGLFSIRSRRLVIALLMTVAIYCTISSRAHMGVAMVCMVNATATTTATARAAPSSSPTRSTLFGNVSLQPTADECSLKVSESSGVSGGYKGTFLWTPEQQSLIFSAGYFGNFAVMFFSGYLADRFGPKTIAMLSVAGMAITMILSPLFAHWGLYGLFCLRIVFGVFENPAFPALSAMVPRWFVVEERSTVAGLYTSGNQLATSLGVFIANNLCRAEFIGGWPLIFYVTAAISVVWCVFWWLTATDYPSQSTFLRPAERDHLVARNECHLTKFADRKEAGQALPLREMLKSKPVWACIVVQFSMTLGNTLFHTYLPSYARDVMALNLRDNGVFTSLPFFIQLASKNVLGIFADFLKKKGVMSSTTCCRVFQSLTTVGIIVTFFLMAFYVDCTRTTQALVLLCIYGFCYGAVVPGVVTSYLSIAPSFTGIISSMVMVAISIGNFMAPTLVGLLVPTGQRSEYSKVFIIIAVLNLFAGSFFAVFGSAQIQPWAEAVMLRNKDSGDSVVDDSDTENTTRSRD